MISLRKNKIGYIYGIAILLLLLAAVLGVLFGSSELRLSDMLSSLIAGDMQSPEARILLYVRLPRVLGSLICGMALAVSGAVIQGALIPVLLEDYPKAEAYAERLVEKALELGGTCTAEHGVGLRKRKFLPKEHGPALEWMRRLKALFDPEGLLNPGKVV